MTETKDPKRNSKIWFLIVLGLVSAFMYLSVIYKYS